MKKIVFDLDDTLWDLNKRACKLANVDYMKLTTFLLTDNKNLKKREKEKLLSLYGNPMLWNDIKWLDGVERLKNLEKLGAKVYINSNCMNQRVLDYKRSFLSDALKLPNDQIILNVSEATKKYMIDDMYIFVDDSPYNILKSNAEYNILFNRPWNQNIIATRFNNLNKIIDICEVLLKKEQLLEKLKGN